MESKHNKRSGDVEKKISVQNNGRDNISHDNLETGAITSETIDNAIKSLRSQVDQVNAKDAEWIEVEKPKLLENK